jgi:hypothetical protein
VAVVAAGAARGCVVVPGRTTVIFVVATCGQLVSDFGQITSGVRGLRRDREPWPIGRWAGRSQVSPAEQDASWAALNEGPPVGPVMQPAPDCSTGHWPVEHSTKPQKGDQASRCLRNERSLVLGPFGVWSSWRGAWTFDLARHLSGRRDRLANQPYYDHGSVYWNVAMIVGLLDSVLRQSRCGPAQLGRRPPHYSGP